MASRSSRPPSAALNIPMTKLAGSITDNQQKQPSVVNGHIVEKPKPKPKVHVEKHKRKLQATRDRSPTANFSDGKQIDIVLAYKPLEVSRRKRAEFAKYRRKFENEMRARGLRLEYESKDLSRDGKTAYIKIHTPNDALARQAEMRRIRKPTKKSDLNTATQKSKSACGRFFQRIFHDPFKLKPDLEYHVTDYFTEPYRRKTQLHFIGSSTDTFFTPAERAYLTYDTMKTIQVEVKSKRGHVAKPIAEMSKVAMDPHYKFGRAFKRRPSTIPRLASEESTKADMPAMLKVGIDYLLEMKVYESVYALHDCDMDDLEKYEAIKKKHPSKWPMRMYLYEAWCKPSNIFRHQPLDAIKDYYGERVAFYFAFLGFYTQMLIIPALLGFIVLINGGISIGRWDEMTRISCSDNPPDWIICRDCPFIDCLFRKFREFCFAAKAAAVFDNNATVAYSFVTALWGVSFLALWKRYRAKLASRWNLPDRSEDNNAETEDEPVRPEYEMATMDRRRNPITGKYEPYFDARAKMRRYAASMVTVTFFILIAIGLISSLQIYKVFGTYLWSLALGFHNEKIDYSILTSVVQAVANGIVIWVMSKIYQPVAAYLTKAENHRTDSEYERSYVYKVVVFEFVNYYGALFYLAFIRGQLLPPPHEQGDYQDRCPITGCLLDVTIQLAIIYSGKQVVDSFLEIILPLIRVGLNKLKTKITRKNEKHVRWEEDHELQPNPRILLVSDYFQLFIQYGFVTMFVPAFPLAPFFAFLNNIVQIRIDAYKMLVYTRRGAPIPQHRDTIWTRLTQMVSKVAILTNALLIALTMNFVPKIVFALGYGSDESWSGYVNWTLSEFNTSDWRDRDDELRNWRGNKNITIEQCWYRDFRVSPWVPDPHGLKAYERKKEWWHTLVTRLAFIVVFEHFIFLLQSLIEYLIPAEPSGIVIKKKREDHLQREKFMEDEGVGSGEQHTKDS